ncbi:MAG TPA: ABC-F type ribosomal protection protein [Dictyobacter sp.]|jgi:macrolide transport system ATP-binding/permease protein|nr:ABC-F type ribosomal protection protein [Dictyobacter sp.]
MFLTVKNVSKSYGAHTILDTISFVVQKTDRIGIVGPNGVGKSTLLRLLVEQETADSGNIHYGPGIEFGYLEQAITNLTERTLQDLLQDAQGQVHQLEECMHTLEQRMETVQPDHITELLEEYNTIVTLYQERGGYEMEYRTESILSGLRLDYLPRTQPLTTLSGGEKARLGMAMLLLRSPDILLLDEPTNHLDFASLDWLESYLNSYAGAVVTVSHDRQFLNKMVRSIFEIDEHTHQLKIYTGNYDAYVEAKHSERKKWLENYERQQEEIKELRKRIRLTGRQLGHPNRQPRDNDKFARHFFAQNIQSAVASNVRAAQVQLERIETDPIPKPPELLQINTNIQTRPLQAQAIIRLSHVSKYFGERCIFSNISLTIAATTRLLLIGPNGTGKTTLLKLITGLEQPDQGEINILPGARIGYLAQDPISLDPGMTVIDAYRYGQIGFEEDFIGRLIGYGLFRLEDIQKKVGQLSIGQQRKLEIARIMAQEPNVLLLDEPTNYISLDILEAFEITVQQFPGPVLAISHDRWFMQRFAGEEWQITEAG